ncbi:sulfite exporter TauE/SafE family protein [Arthrobacter sp. 3Tela_A]|uniref:sulfite exporter TauE/SafE family protein n=1 Tax=Arthrobacter sp. 3Tela_A TaxID=3093743 RepID=UPI003BB5E893
METVLLGLAVGLAVGAVVGLVGAGGAIIAVPALVYVVGLEPEEAVPTSLIVVGLASLSGAVPRLRRDVSWPLVLMISLPGIPASWAGAAVGELLNPDWLMLCFALIMIVAGVRMLASSRNPAPGARSAEQGGWGGLALRGIPVGLVVGFLTGLLGVGGGFLIIPALTLLLGVPMARAIGTSLVIIAVNSASGFAAHLDGLAIDWTLILSFAAMAMASSLATARLAHRLNEAVVSRIFAAVIFTVALGVLVQTVPKLLPTEAEEQTDQAAASASLAASRLSFGERSLNVLMENHTTEDLVITAARLETDVYTAPAQWIPTDGDATTLRPGGRVALPMELPEAACDSGTGFDAVVRLDVDTAGTGRAGELVVPAADPYGTVAEAHGRDCLQQEVDAVASFTLAPNLEIREDGRTAVVRILVTPSGERGSVSIRIGTTTLLSEAPGQAWPREIKVDGTDEPSVLELAAVPARCDPHALAEDKAGTRFPLEVGGGRTRTGQLRLEPPAEFTAAVYGFVRSACAVQ